MKTAEHYNWFTSPSPKEKKKSSKETSHKTKIDIKKVNAVIQL